MKLASIIFPFLCVYFFLPFSVRAEIQYLVSKRSYSDDCLIHSHSRISGKKSHKKSQKMFYCTWYTLYIYFFIILISFFFSKPFFILFAFSAKKNQFIYLSTKYLTSKKLLFAQKFPKQGGDDEKQQGKRNRKGERKGRKTFKMNNFEHAVFKTSTPLQLHSKHFDWWSTDFFWLFRFSLPQKVFNFFRLFFTIIAVFWSLERDLSHKNSRI